MGQPLRSTVGIRRYRERRTEVGARRALLRLCALHDHEPRVARCPRRPQAGASAHPLRHAAPAPGPQHGVQEMREDRRRRDGRFPSPRRPGDLRCAGAPLTGFRAALSAGGWPGQFRQYRRRWPRRLPLHRGAADGGGAPAPRRDRRGHGRFPAVLQWREGRAHRPAGGLPEPARQRLPGHRGGHGHLDPAAQRGRTLRRGALSHRPSRGDVGPAPHLRERARFSHRRHSDR